jgi:hypothetical protein
MSQLMTREDRLCKVAQILLDIRQWPPLSPMEPEYSDDGYSKPDLFEEED